MKTIIIKTAASLILVLALTSANAGTPATTPDWAKEKRWEQQIVPQLITGEGIHLQANGKNFLGLYTEADTDTPKGAVILVHGGGVHPDWPQVIHPLRVSLPEQGWATLSIQMPVLHNGASEEEYAPLVTNYSPDRIKAAVDYLAKKHIDNIFLVAHSVGAAMASNYLAQSHDMRVTGFVGIGMNGERRKGNPQLDNVNAILQINQPVLDVYGSHADKYIIDSADRRMYAISVHNIPSSKQVKIEGSDHFYEGFEGQLQKNITAFMDEITPHKKNVNLSRH